MKGEIYTWKSMKTDSLFEPTSKWPLEELQPSFFTPAARLTVALLSGSCRFETHAT